MAFTKGITAMCLAVLMLFVACNKEEEDTTKPTLEFLANGRADTVHLLAGGVLQLTGSFADNNQLSSYRLIVADSLQPNGFNSFEETLVANIDGTTAPFTENIVVPDSSAAGIYSLTLEALDASGNVGKSELTLYLSHPDQPTFTVTQPNFTNGHVAAIGDTIDLQGNSASPLHLTELPYTLGEWYFLYYDFADTTVTNFNLALPNIDGYTIDIPDTTASGTYYLHLDAINTAGHLKRLEGTVLVQ